MKGEINHVRRTIMRFLTSGVGKSTSPEKIKAILDKKDTDVRILIIRPNSRLGNQLLITPLLEEITDIFPNCKIDIFVRGNLAPILFQNYKQVDRIIKLPPKPFKALLKYAKVWFSVRKHRYDIVINIEGNSSSGRLLTKLSRSNLKIFGENIPELETKFSDYLHTGKKAVYNLRNSIGKDPSIAISPLSFRLNTNELKNGKLVLEQLVNNNKPTICIYTFATGGKCFSKDWWKYIYTHLKDKYEGNYNILEVLPKENVSQIDFAATPYYSTDIREMGAVIANSMIFITADCGIMHLASSVGTPTVGFFSYTDPQKYEPYNKNSIAIETEKISKEDIVIEIDKILNTITNTN